MTGARLRHSHVGEDGLGRAEWITCCEGHLQHRPLGWCGGVAQKFKQALLGYKFISGPKGTRAFGARKYTILQTSSWWWFSFLNTATDGNLSSVQKVHAQLAREDHQTLRTSVKKVTCSDVPHEASDTSGDPNPIIRSLQRSAKHEFHPITFWHSDGCWRNFRRIWKGSERQNTVPLLMLKSANMTLFGALQFCLTGYQTVL